MSDAVNPNMNSDLPPSNKPIQPNHGEDTPQTPVSPIPEKSEDGWQAIAFPGAISLDTLPQDKPSPAAGLEQSPEWIKLRQENAHLRSQASQLERDLSQLQIELQLEVARFYCKEQERSQGSPVPPQTSGTSSAALIAAQSQIQQLSQDLGLSQDVVQQQQLLVETLTAQLETSQERIAQLERDCAVTQQRYNEQFQLTLQAETLCRDLRMRLHRQQRQALQFKAALEKSLEMSATNNAPPVEIEPISVIPTSLAAAPLFVPKAQPVQPWSTQPGSPVKQPHPAHADAEALPNLLSKLMLDPVPVDSSSPAEKPSQGTGLQPPVVPAMDQSPAAANATENFLETEVQLPNNVTHLFSIDAPNPLNPAVAQSAPADSFDLNPLIQTGGVDTAQVALSPPVDERSPLLQDPATHASPSDSPENTLWADLARLIDPQPTTDPLPQQVASSPQPVNSPFITLSDLYAISEDAAMESSTEADGDSTSPPPNWPSPILYPLRSPKKIRSMAAVDLPSFPRTAQR